MDVVLGTFVVLGALIGLLGVFILGSVHVIRCTESSQERFSWGSVGRSISFAGKLAVAALCSVPKALALGVKKLYSEVNYVIRHFVKTGKF